MCHQIVKLESCCRSHRVHKVDFPINSFHRLTGPLESFLTFYAAMTGYDPTLNSGHAVILYGRGLSCGSVAAYEVIYSSIKRSRLDKDVSRVSYQKPAIGKRMFTGDIFKKYRYCQKVHCYSLSLAEFGNLNRSFLYLVNTSGTIYRDWTGIAFPSTMVTIYKCISLVVLLFFIYESSRCQVYGLTVKRLEESDEFDNPKCIKGCNANDCDDFSKNCHDAGGKMYCEVCCICLCNGEKVGSTFVGFLAKCVKNKELPSVFGYKLTGMCKQHINFCKHINKPASFSTFGL